MERFFKANCVEAGSDEAGRGCLAGPVYAAAVILPPDFPKTALNDSKKLSEKNRNTLRDVIEKYSIWSVASASAEEIDELNILRASITAMHRAIAQLTTEPEYLAIDGNRFYPYANTPHSCIVKGDGKYESIAAASILAKTHRDDYMCELHEKYPNYHWNCNKGYPTATHKEAILKFGITPFHRKSFSLLDKQYELNF
ncbi:RNase HII [Balneicella halophila]|uniref:Ribonuclease HII n=1 Tax=Balneicella halophila TaxID=1537566 RepID=A0A7L4UNL6_BALHA|nr:ribonuclease HII [Balneicella halophila]PVX50705.1 RNase HII [Balneicella halophila]